LFSRGWDSTQEAHRATVVLDYPQQFTMSVRFECGLSSTFFVFY